MGKKNKGLSTEFLTTGFGTGLGHIDKVDLGESTTVQKEKYKKPEVVTGPCSYEQMLRDAENFEGYLNTVKYFAILKNVSPEKYKKSVKRIEKMIQLLREGKGDKVYNKERYEEYQERLNNRGY